MTGLTAQRIRWLISLAALATLAACGEGAIPAGPDAVIVEAAGKRPSRVKLTTDGYTTTSTDGYVTVVSARAVRTGQATIGPAGGEIVVDETGGKPQDNLLVIFTVPPGALSETTAITMTVEGDLLSELVVDFQPSGVRFSPWAQLYYQIGDDRVDVEPTQLTVVHIYDDGTEEPVGQDLNHTGNSKTWQMWIDVPGFSRYGLRRGT